VVDAALFEFFDNLFYSGLYHSLCLSLANGKEWRDYKKLRIKRIIGELFEGTMVV